MANIAFVKITNNEEYQDVETLAGTAFTAGTAYLMQVQGVATICLSAEKPEEGGFVLYNSPVFQYTPNGTDKLWIKTVKQVAYLNVSTQA